MKARIVQGDDVELIIDLKYKDETALNVAGASAIRFTAKRDVCGTAFIEKTLGAGVALASPATQITVTLSHTDTSDSNLPAGKYYFEVEITDAGGNVMTVRDYNDHLGILEVLADLDQ